MRKKKKLRRPRLSPVTECDTVSAGIKSKGHSYQGCTCMSGDHSKALQRIKGGWDPQTRDSERAGA